MKKPLCVIICFAIIFAFCSCGKIAPKIANGVDPDADELNLNSNFEFDLLDNAKEIDFSGFESEAEGYGRSVNGSRTSYLIETVNGTDYITKIWTQNKKANIFGVSMGESNEKIKSAFEGHGYKCTYKNGGLFMEKGNVIVEIFDDCVVVDGNITRNIHIGYNINK